MAGGEATRLRIKTPYNKLLTIYYLVLGGVLLTIISVFIFTSDFVKLQPLLFSLSGLWTILFFLGISLYKKVFAPLKELHLGLLYLSQARFNYRLSERTAIHYPDLTQLYRILSQELNSYEQKAKEPIAQLDQNRNRISELEKKISELTDRNLYLEEKDKIKTDFLSVVAHELRTPLASIKGFASTLVLRDKSINELKRREYLKIIDVEADRLARLIEDLLSLSRIELGKIKMQWESVDIIKVIKRVLDRLSIKSAAIQFNFDFPAEFPNISGDEDHLERIFVNLIGNAIKYSHPQGTITVSGRSTDDNKVRISITDQGVGIAPDKLKKIFEKFYRVDDEVNRTVHGTGLGLAICKAIVEAHGGEIWAESELNKGTSIFFNLPIKKREEQAEIVTQVERTNV